MKSRVKVSLQVNESNSKVTCHVSCNEFVTAICTKTENTSICNLNVENPFQRLFRHIIGNNVTGLHMLFCLFKILQWISLHFEPEVEIKYQVKDITFLSQYHSTS